jgi:hypothetical protein
VQVNFKPLWYQDLEPLVEELIEECAVTERWERIEGLGSVRFHTIRA